MTERKKRKRGDARTPISARMMAILLALGLALPTALLPLLNRNHGQTTDLLWMGWISFWLIFISYRLITWFVFGEPEAGGQFETPSTSDVGQNHLD